MKGRRGFYAVLLGLRVFWEVFVLFLFVGLSGDFRCFLIFCSKCFAKFRGKNKGRVMKMSVYSSRFGI